MKEVVAQGTTEREMIQKISGDHLCPVQTNHSYSSAKCEKCDCECYHLNRAEHFLTIKVKYQFHLHLCLGFEACCSLE